MLPSCLILQKA